MYSKKLFWIETWRLIFKTNVILYLCTVLLAQYHKFELHILLIIQRNSYQWKNNIWFLTWKKCFISIMAGVQFVKEKVTRVENLYLRCSSYICTTQIGTFIILASSCTLRQYYFDSAKLLSKMVHIHSISLRCIQSFWCAFI